MLVLQMLAQAVALGEPGFPHADCKADAADMATVTSCLEVAMPGWVAAAGSFGCEPIGGGLTNHLFHCLPQPEAAETRPLLFRVYGAGSDAMVDRAQETDVLINLDKRGFATGLYATFTNGRIERFLSGRTLSVEEMREPRFRKLIARQLYNLHQIDDMPMTLEKTNHTPPPPTNAEEHAATLPADTDLAVHDHGASLWHSLDKFLALVRSAAAHEQKEGWRPLDLPPDISVDRIEEAISQLKTIVHAWGPEVAFTHGDCQCLNLLYEESSGESGKEAMTLIDFEYSAHNYRAYDLANHITEWMGYGPIRWELQADDNEIRDFVSSYVAASGLEPNAMNALETEIFSELQVLEPAPHLFWGLWALVQHTLSDIEFDWQTYAHERLRYASKLLIADASPTARTGRKLPGFSQKGEL